MFYRVAWTVSQNDEVKEHTYIASLDDAWELWHWLTSRSVMEPEYHKRLVEQKRESALFAVFYVPPVIKVKVYELNGREVSPENGLDGMYQLK